MPQQPIRAAADRGDRKLFTAGGVYVTTVNILDPAKIINWRGRYFVEIAGAYRECQMSLSDEPPR